MNVCKRKKTNARRCLRCGTCCEEIWVRFAPHELAEVSDETHVDGDLVKSILVYTGENRNGAYRYACRWYLGKLGGRGVCANHAGRPRMCREFPFYHKKAPERVHPECAAST